MAIWAWHLFTSNTLLYLFQALSELASRQLIDCLAFCMLECLNDTPCPSVAFFNQRSLCLSLGIYVKRYMGDRIIFNAEK
jgi:hypothetical protein